jgi:pimeloyl-ACP methyl ester carboxylesterase
MAKVLINGINVHYQAKGAGPNVVLIHGITSCLAQWYVDILPTLALQYRVTAYDLRGHGLTDLTEHGYSSLDMTKDLLALLDALDIQEASLIGHSFGGAIALHCALLKPERVRSIVLLDTGLACLRHLRVIHDWPGWEQHGDDLAKFGITLESFLSADQQQDVTGFIEKSLSIPLQSGFRKGLSPLTPRLKRLLTESRMGYEFREVAGLTEEALTRIPHPVLSLYGGDSPYERMAKRLQELLPQSCYRVLAGSGHFYAVEEPQLVVANVSEFLADPRHYVQRQNELAAGFRAVCDE